MTRRDVDKLQEEIEELFADLWQVPRFSGLRHGFRPNVDCFHTDEPHALTVVVELPGVEAQSIRVVAGERLLVIAGERKRPAGPGARLPAGRDRVRPVPAARPSPRGRRPGACGGALRARRAHDRAARGRARAARRPLPDHGRAVYDGDRLRRRGAGGAAARVSGGAAGAAAERDGGLPAVDVAARDRPGALGAVDRRRGRGRPAARAHHHQGRRRSSCPAGPTSTRSGRSRSSTR